MRGTRNINIAMRRDTQHVLNIGPLAKLLLVLNETWAKKRVNYLHCTFWIAFY